MRMWRRLRFGLPALTVMALVLAGFAVPTAVAQPAFSGSTALPPDGGSLAAQWTATQDAPPQYPTVHIDWDVPITMSDGTVLKANVYRPADSAGRPIDTPTPTLVNMTPYTKLISMLTDSAQSIPGFSDFLLNWLGDLNFSGTPFSGFTELTQALNGGLMRNFTVDRKLIQSGYTQVVVDVRGTGFSQGIWQVFGQREQQDTVEVIDWASKQHWSNGKVGMTGVSYSAINQVKAAEMNPPALKAIFPAEPGSDLMRDVLATGGGLGVGFIPLWLALVDTLKLVPNVQSIFQGNFDMKWLADREASPFTFFDLLIAALTTPSVNDIPPSLQALLEDGTPLRQGIQGDPSKIRIPTFVIGGWHDIFTNSEPTIYNEIPLPTTEKKLIMGDTYHLNGGSGFGKPGNPPRLDVLQRAWFDHWLKGIDNGIEKYGPTTLWQQGGGWITSPTFPQAGVDYRRMYLSAAPSGTTNTSLHDGSLTPAPAPGDTRLTVGPGVMSLCSRDNAQITAGVSAIIVGCTTDARPNELNGLTFTSAPVNAPTIISGPVNVHLNTVLDATDGYWNATLNDVAPDGRSTVLTSGQLTASLRALDQSRSRRSANGDLTEPVHTLTLSTRQPIVPGQPTALDVGLTATDAVLQPGHRLRVDVFAGNFPRGLLLRPLLNESGLRQQHLQLDPNSPSWVNVPLSQPIA
ncbi:CocE/NonD family hydrolase [Skermania sp. ID1734]|uniref:CocE/NonD family hydrolase n=1 Tax=Skermania sp. ID1734 TaxID=2597516 RepID=UPI00117BEEE6|nr:CocE/NonD family hydrolase [Skermania sp. ID1734]TSE00761.1 CocE/NonD family hydrolase [Skermania sp. ID1734]